MQRRFHNNAEFTLPPELFMLSLIFFALRGKKKNLEADGFRTV